MGRGGQPGGGSGEIRDQLAGDELVRRSGQDRQGAGRPVERGPADLSTGARRRLERRQRARGESGQGQALRREGMARASLVRHDPPDLPAGVRPAARLGRRDRGGRRQDAREDALHDAQLRRRDVAVQLRADQPAGARAGDRDQGREPAQGPRPYAPRPRPGSALPYRQRGVRGRPQHRDDAGQGGQADAALPADPVQPGHGPGARDAADHLPAVDQPLLHPRPQPEEELHQMGGRPGADRVRRLLEIRRREPRRRQARRPSSPPRSTSPKRATSCSSSATSRWS